MKQTSQEESTRDQTSSSSEAINGLTFNGLTLKIYVIIGCNLAFEYTNKGNISTAVDVLLNTFDIVNENLKKIVKRSKIQSASRASSSNSTSRATSATGSRSKKLKEEKEQLNFMKAVLAFNISSLMMRRKKYNSSLNFAKIALKKFSHYGNSEYSSFFYLNVATVLCLMKNYADAQVVLVDCLIIIRYLKYHKGKEFMTGSGHFKLSLIWTGSQTPQDLSKSVEEELVQPKVQDVYIDNWTFIMKIVAYHNFSLCKAHFQSYTKAVKLCTKALDIAKPIFSVLENNVIPSLAKTLKYAKRMGETASAYAGNILLRPSLEPEQILQQLTTVVEVKKKLVELLPFLSKMEGFKDLNILTEEDEDEFLRKTTQSSQSTRSAAESTVSDTDKFLLKSSLKNTIIAARNETGISSSVKKKTPTKSGTASRVVLPPVKKRQIQTSNTVGNMSLNNTSNNVNTDTPPQQKVKPKSAPKPKKVPSAKKTKKAEEIVAEVVTTLTEKKDEEKKLMEEKLEIDPHVVQAVIKVQQFFRKVLARKRAASVKSQKEQQLRDFLAEERKWFEQNMDQFDTLLKEEE